VTDKDKDKDKDVQQHSTGHQSDEADEDGFTRVTRNTVRYAREITAVQGLGGFCLIMPILFKFYLRLSLESSGAASIWSGGQPPMIV